jgi:hypothetical protein
MERVIRQTSSRIRSRSRRFRDAGTLFTRGGRLVSISVIVLVVGFTPQLAGGQEETLVGVESAALTDDQLAQIDFYRNVLRQEANLASDRARAARSLVQMGWPEALEVLVDGLSEEPPTPGVVQAIAEGIATATAAPRPPDQLADALVRALRIATPETRTGLVRAVASYPPELIVPLLVASATDAAAPVEQRLGPVAGLGRFHTNQAIDALIGLLDASTPVPVREEASRSLQSTTGLTFAADDPDLWRNWWVENRDVSRETRLSNLVTSLSAQVEAGEARIQRISRRLIGMVQRLYTVTPPDARSALLASLLADEEPQIRVAALDLVERAMADAVALDREVNEALYPMLTDPAPTNRARVARILRTLGDNRVGPEVARVLPAEQHPQALREFLAVLARSPQPEACDRLLELLRDPNWRAEAGEALVAHSDAGMLDPDSPGRIAALLKSMPLDNPAPSSVQLLARFGSDEDRQRLVPLLETGTNAVKRSLASELAKLAAFTDVLLAAGADPAIHPSAIRAVVTHRTGVPRVEALLSLARSDNGSRSAWMAALETSIAPLSLADRVAIDDRMLSDERAVVRGDARLVLLESTPTAQAPPPDQQEPWIELVIRLAERRIEQGQLGNAAGLLDRVRPLNPNSGRFLPTQLTAWLLQGNLEAAAALPATPAHWLAALETALARAPDRCPSILAAIDERFADTLDEADQARLEALRAQVAQLARANGAAAADQPDPEAGT